MELGPIYRGKVEANGIGKEVVLNRPRPHRGNAPASASSASVSSLYTYANYWRSNSQIRSLQDNFPYNQLAGVDQSLPPVSSFQQRLLSPVASPKLRYYPQDASPSRFFRVQADGEVGALSSLLAAPHHLAVPSTPSRSYLPRTTLHFQLSLSSLPAPSSRQNHPSSTLPSSICALSASH